MMRLCVLALMVSGGGAGFAQTTGSTGPPMVRTPPGTTLPLVIVRALPRKGAAVHDAVYAQTVGPLVVHGQVLIPAGTPVQGEVEAITQPKFFRSRPSVTIHFPRAVLSNSYVVPLDDELSGARETVQLALGVTIANEFLLDTGTSFDLPLRTPLTIDESRLPAASSGPGPLASSSTCRPTAGIPGTPGSPDTVIPGTPGTPPTVIPGIDGGAPTIIPGMPATPPTVIPGMPGTPGVPGTACPSAPRVKTVVLVP